MILPKLRMSDDLLHGADAISEYLFGTTAKRRRVYHWAENKMIPAFKIGNVVCARKSTLREWIEKQEQGLEP